MGFYFVFMGKILNMGITGSIAILAVLLFRILLIKAPKRFSYVLWGIVLFRLLCPVSFSSSVSLLNFADSAVTGNGEIEYLSVNNFSKGKSSIMISSGMDNNPWQSIAENFFHGLIPQTTDTSSGNSTTATEKTFPDFPDTEKNSSFYATDAEKETPSLATDDEKDPPSLATDAKKETSSYVPGTKKNFPLGTPSLETGKTLLSFLSQKASLPPKTFLGIPIALCFTVWLLGMATLACSGILSAFRLQKQVSCCMKLRENIYLADYISSPFVFGFLHPNIYLPSFLNEREQPYIILHEQHHILRKDHLFKILAFFALCLHWFNPLVWLAFVLSAKDMEMSCDEAVMEKLSLDIRAEYTESLLHLAVGKRKIAGVPLSFGESDIKSRIKNLMRYKKPSTAIIISAVAVCVLGAFCLLTNPATVDSTKNMAKDEKEEKNTTSKKQENSPEKRFQQVAFDEEAAIQKAIMEYNDSHYSDDFDFSCCNFVNLETNFSEKDGHQNVTYYGWALYEEYKFFEDRMENIAGSHTPVALTFQFDQDGYQLQEYWEPGSGDDFYKDIQMKFPPSISSGDSIDSQKFITAQKQDCYAQAIAYGDLDTIPIIERLLNEICSGLPEETSNPQDYIDSHAWEYQELSYYYDFTIDYCISRFEGGGVTGLDGHIMARIMQDLMETNGKLPVTAKGAPNGQEWYDSIKTDAPDFLKKYLEPEEKPLNTKLGIPIYLTHENSSWIQNPILNKSEEHYLEFQYYDSILDGECTLYVAKDGEIALPKLEDTEWAEEQWEGETKPGEVIYVNVQYNETWVLARWEYKNYKFAILGNLPASEPDISPVAKTALYIIMKLE